MAPTRPDLVVNPRSDTAFVGRVYELLGAGVDRPEALQAALRVDYPLAVVRERGLSSEPTTVWYIYREGHWVP